MTCLHASPDPAMQVHQDVTILQSVLGPSMQIQSSCGLSRILCDEQTFLFKNVSSLFTGHFAK